jgi:flagellar hook assembly protein FlgD
MFKKLLSFASIFAIMGMIFPSVVFAADINVEELIATVDLSVQNGSAQNFQPANGQTLNAVVTFGSTALANATGTVEVRQGTVVIKTLQTISGINPPANFILSWNGKDIDNTDVAKAVCGTLGAACPNGDYTVIASVSSASGENNLVDSDSAAFKITTPPAIDITSLTVTPATFNPITQTADISFGISTGGFITVQIMDGATEKKSLLNSVDLTAGAHSKTDQSALAWNGKDNTGATVSNKAYTVKVTSKQTADGATVDTETTTVTVNTPSTLSITTFTVTPVPVKSGGTFDPSVKGDNQDLEIEYVLNQTADSVLIEIKDSKDNILKNQTIASTANGKMQFWDGMFSGKLALPGVYKAKITAYKSGETAVTSSKDFTVAYANANKGDLQDFNVVPDSFDPDVEEAFVEFKNTVDSDLTVEIQESDGDVIRTFSGYKNTNHDANKIHSIAWDGKNDSGSFVSLATYKAVVVSRNDYGVVLKEKSVVVNDSGGSTSTSNAHISGISFSPSSKFDPAKYDELKIQFDVEQDLDSLKILATHGSQSIELYNEEDVEEENNIEITWNGTDDDDEYAVEGSWKIKFYSKIGSTELLAVKSITFEYEEPQIDDLYLSKEKFDNDAGEFTYVIFRVDYESNVTIKLLEDNKEVEDVTEDLNVEANKWYAVQFDGGSYDYNDDLDLKLIAENTANENVFDSAKISVDLAEDSVSTNKSNITQDYIESVVTNGDDEMTLYYDIDLDAGVTATIHKGKTSSGTAVITLLNAQKQTSGQHSISWNGKDKDGKKLAAGFYTYKILSKANGSDTETGLFVVGAVGDGGDYSSSGDSSSGGETGVNVIIDGGEEISSSEEISTEEISGECAGFSDVDSGDSNCEAIEWVKEQDIFKGYSDSTFGYNQAINRVELLKVLMEFLEIDVSPVAGNLGFSDVEAGAWYMPYIAAAKDLGIFQGDAGKSTARPADSVNRAESLKLTFESLKAVTGYIASTCGSTYPDVKSSDWYYKYVCAADKYDLFEAIDGVNFIPGLFATRAEVAAMLFKLNKVGLL